MCGIVVYHGPNIATPRILDSDKREDSQESLFRTLFNAEYLPSHPVSALKSGKARGQIVGGNLTNPIGLIGTPYEPDTAGKVLFLEDTGKPVHHI